MVKYKLIKEYPGSPKLGTIVEGRFLGDYHDVSMKSTSITSSFIENQSEYWQEVKELTLLEEAKLRYPIGTKFIPTARPSRDTNTSVGNFRDDNEFIVCSKTSVSVYNKISKKWAEIVDDFVLPEKWCIKDIPEVKEYFEEYNNGNYTCDRHAYLHFPRIKGCCYYEEILYEYTEITFEQFKKYVLKEEVVVNNVIEVVTGLGKGLIFPHQKVKVVEKDYEILEFICNKNTNSLIKGDIIKKQLNENNFKGVSQDGEIIADSLKVIKVENLLKLIHWSIYSIKRLSDGEIFTIGDIVNGFDIKKTDITRIRLQDNKLQIGLRHLGFYQLKSLTKYIIKPLFTTEDGVDIFEGDNIYGIKFYIGEHELKSLIAHDKDVLSTFVRFSTREKAEEYVLMNKPCLSFLDIYDNLKVKDREFVLNFIRSKIK